jgi:hypothetical protein
MQPSQPTDDGVLIDRIASDDAVDIKQELSQGKTIAPSTAAREVLCSVVQHILQPALGRAPIASDWLVVLSALAAQPGDFLPLSPQAFFARLAAYDPSGLGRSLRARGVIT